MTAQKKTVCFVGAHQLGPNARNYLYETVFSELESVPGIAIVNTEDLKASRVVGRFMESGNLDELSAHARNEHEGRMASVLYSDLIVFMLGPVDPCLCDADVFLLGNAAAGKKDCIACRGWPFDSESVAPADFISLTCKGIIDMPDLKDKIVSLLA